MYPLTWWLALSLSFPPSVWAQAIDQEVQALLLQRPHEKESSGGREGGGKRNEAPQPAARMAPGQPHEWHLSEMNLALQNRSSLQFFLILNIILEEEWLIWSVNLHKFRKKQTQAEQNAYLYYTEHRWSEKMWLFLWNQTINESHSTKIYLNYATLDSLSFQKNLFKSSTLKVLKVPYPHFLGIWENLICTSTYLPLHANQNRAPLI